MRRFGTGVFVCLCALVTGMFFMSCSGNVSTSAVLSFGETSFLPSRNGGSASPRQLIGISVKSDGGYYEARAMDVEDKMPAVIFDNLPIDATAVVSIRCFEFRAAISDPSAENPVSRFNHYDSMNYYGTKSLVVGEGENRVEIVLQRPSGSTSSPVRYFFKSADNSLVFSFFTDGRYYCIHDNEYNQCAVGLYDGSFDESGTVCLYEAAYKKVMGQADGITGYSEDFVVVRNLKKNEVKITVSDDAAAGQIYSFSVTSRNGKKYVFKSAMTNG